MSDWWIDQDSLLFSIIVSVEHDKSSFRDTPGYSVPLSIGLLRRPDIVEIEAGLLYYLDLKLAGVFPSSPGAPGAEIPVK